jgi:hypothetical protein
MRPLQPEQSVVSGSVKSGTQASCPQRIVIMTRGAVATRLISARRSGESLVRCRLMGLLSRLAREVNSFAALRTDGGEDGRESRNGENGVAVRTGCAPGFRCIERRERSAGIKLEISGQRGLRRLARRVLDEDKFVIERCTILRACHGSACR